MFTAPTLAHTNACPHQRGGLGMSGSHMGALVASQAAACTSGPKLWCATLSHGRGAIASCMSRVLSSDGGEVNSVSCVSRLTTN